MDVIRNQNFMVVDQLDLSAIPETYWTYSDELPLNQMLPCIQPVPDSKPLYLFFGCPRALGSTSTSSASGVHIRDAFDNDGTYGLD